MKLDHEVRVLLRMLDDLTARGLESDVSPEQFRRWLDTYTIGDVQLIHDYARNSMHDRMSQWIHDIVCPYLVERKQHSASVN